MENSEQINIELSKNLAEAVRKYAEVYGYKNIQELANESLRGKIFDDNEFDETFSDNEIELIDSLIIVSKDKKVFISEDEINKILIE